MKYKSLRFINEPIKVFFDKEPMLSKIQGCPNRFEWHSRIFEVVELISEWHDYSRKGRMSQNMRPSHAGRASRKGSWGVGVDNYRVRITSGRYFDIYYDRAPKDADNRTGSWFIYRELIPEENIAD